MIHDNKYFKSTQWFLMIVIIVFLIGQLGYILNPLRTIIRITVLPILIASLFYYLLRPVVRYLTLKNIHKSIAVLGVLLVLVVIIVILIVYAGGTIQQEFSSFYDTLLEYLQQAEEKATDLLEQEKLWIFSREDIENRLSNSAEAVFGAFGENVFGWVNNITTFMTIFILIPIVAFFLLKDDEQILNTVSRLIPNKHKDNTVELLKDMDNVLSVYFTGQLIVAFFLGLLTYVGYLFIGLPNALFLATFTMLTSIIPFLGPLLGILPAIFIAWTLDLFMVVKVIIVLAITQQLEGSVIRPHIMGSRLEIHPLVIIFLVIIAITLYGFIGAFFAIPFYAMLRILVRFIFQNKKNHDVPSSGSS